MYRQGDILLKEIENITGNEIGKTEKVLAEGSTTGHKHILKGAEVTFYDKDGLIQINIPKQAKLTHDEHATITIPKGKYEVVKQREFDLVKGVREVSD